VTEEDTNDYQDGGEFLTVVEKLAHDLHGEVHAEVISIIAGRYAKLEFLDYAIELAETIFDPFTRDNTFAQIAAASITNGNSDYAGPLLEAIEDPAVRSMAIENIAIKYAELGDVDRSLEFVNELDDADHTLRGIALVDATASPRSIELALSITSAELRADTLGQLAAVAHRAERTSEATELVEESLQAAEEIEFSQSSIYALIGVASISREIGDTDRAQEILSHALELCEDFEGQPPWGLSSTFARSEALAQIVEGLARLGQFEQADLAAEQIEDPYPFARASAQQAIAYYRAAQKEQAMTLLSEALELVLEEPVYGTQGLLAKDTVLAELALSFAIVGQLEKSLAVIKNLNTEAQQHTALEQIGKECARAGNSRGIYEIAKSITNNYATTSYWLAVTDVLRESTEPELAHNTLLEAAKQAVVIEDDYEKAVSLIEVAYRFALINDSAKASEIFIPALNTIKELDHDDKKALSLLRMDQRFRELYRKPSEEERYLLSQIQSQ
jgi:tetratricopeptide (TPR) repeat protein